MQHFGARPLFLSSCRPPSFPPSFFPFLLSKLLYFLLDCWFSMLMFVFLINLPAHLGTSVACSKYVGSSSEVSSPQPWLLHGIRECSQSFWYTTNSIIIILIIMFIVIFSNHDRQHDNRIEPLNYRVHGVTNQENILKLWVTRRETPPRHN